MFGRQFLFDIVITGILIFLNVQVSSFLLIPDMITLYIFTTFIIYTSQHCKSLGTVSNKVKTTCGQVITGGFVWVEQCTATTAIFRSACRRKKNNRQTNK